MKKIILLFICTLALFATTSHSAKILESLSSGGYTYMKVQEGKDSYWIAMTQRAVKVGDTIEYTEQGWMKNFHSKTLNRTFDDILFAGDKKSHVTTQLENAKTNTMHSKYQEKGTISIAELFANRDKYVGKTVVIKGEVTKTSQAIMRLNWVHIQDGSNFSEMNDLVFTTTQDVPKDGEVVYAKGVVVKDKDFGYGYFYPLIIQEAQFSK